MNPYRSPKSIYAEERQLNRTINWLLLPPLVIFGNQMLVDFSVTTFLLFATLTLGTAGIVQSRIKSIFKISRIILIIFSVCATLSFVGYLIYRPQINISTLRSLVFVVIPLLCCGVHLKGSSADRVIN